jgi:quercetin dioxygenase-like cupin family protein
VNCCDDQHRKSWAAATSAVAMLAAIASRRDRDPRTRRPPQPVMSDATSMTRVDDEQIRVTTWTFGEVGASTGPHVHEYDYVVVPVTGGTFNVTDSDGATKELTQHAGVPYRGTAGTAHDVVNGVDGPAVFVEIELKG